MTAPTTTSTTSIWYQNHTVSPIRPFAWRRTVQIPFPAMGGAGLSHFCGGASGPSCVFAPHIRAYRDAYKAAGHTGDGQVFLACPPVYVADTVEQAMHEPEASIMHFYRYLGERLEDSATALRPPRAIEQRAERGQRLQTITFAGGQP